MKTRTIVLIFVAIVVLLVGCGGCGAISFQQNAVKMDENVKAKWGNVQSDYQRRADLIPNLVSTVKGEANFERGTLNDVINARAKATSIQVDPTKLTPENIQQFQQAQNQLSGALSRLLVTVEQYPNLRANDAFRNLQTQLEGTENRILQARRRYNEAIQKYNTTLSLFPNNIVASLSGFTRNDAYFKTDVNSRTAPKVTF